MASISGEINGVGGGHRNWPGFFGRIWGSKGEDPTLLFLLLLRIIERDRSAVVPLDLAHELRSRRREIFLKQL